MDIARLDVESRDKHVLDHDNSTRDKIIIKDYPKHVNPTNFNNHEHAVNNNNTTVNNYNTNNISQLTNDVHVTGNKSGTSPAPLVNSRTDAFNLSNNPNDINIAYATLTSSACWDDDVFDDDDELIDLHMQSRSHNNQNGGGSLSDHDLERLMQTIRPPISYVSPHKVVNGNNGHHIKSCAEAKDSDFRGGGADSRDTNGAPPIGAITTGNSVAPAQTTTTVRDVVNVSHYVRPTTTVSNQRHYPPSSAAVVPAVSSIHDGLAVSGLSSRPMAAAVDVLRSGFEIRRDKCVSAAFKNVDYLQPVSYTPPPPYSRRPVTPQQQVQRHQQQPQQQVQRHQQQHQPQVQQHQQQQQLHHQLRQQTPQSVQSDKYLNHSADQSHSRSYPGHMTTHPGVPQARHSSTQDYYPGSDHQQGHYRSSHSGQISHADAPLQNSSLNNHSAPLQINKPATVNNPSAHIQNISAFQSRVHSERVHSDSNENNSQPVYSSDLSRNSRPAFTVQDYASVSTEPVRQPWPQLA